MDSLSHDQEQQQAREEERAPEFPLGVFPETLGEYVQELARGQKLDPSAVATLMLAVLAGATGGTRRVVLAPGISEPSILWSVLVVEPEVEFRALIGALLSPLRERQQAFAIEHSVAMEEYRLNLLMWRRNRRKMDKILAGGGEITGALAEEYDCPPLSPARPQFICEESQVRAVGHAMTGSNRGTLLARPSGLHEWCEEVLGDATCRNIEWDWWQAMHEGSALEIPESGPKRPGCRSRFAAASVVGAASWDNLIQYDELPQGDQNPLQRMLLVAPVARIQDWRRQAKVDKKQRDFYANIVEDFAGMEWVTEDVGLPRHPREIPLDEAATELWAISYDELARKRAHRDAARLALILKLCRYAGKIDTILPTGVAVDEKCLAGGIELARWYADERQRIWDKLRQEKIVGSRQELFRYLQSIGGTVSVRDLTRFGPRFSSSEKARAALDDLISQGLGMYLPPEKNGKVAFRLKQGTGTPGAVACSAPGEIS